MPRIPTHTIDTAPAGSQPILEDLLNSPVGPGRLLNVQAQLANAPAVLAAYAGMRKAIEAHATLPPATRSAIQVTASAAGHNPYTLAINTMLARRAGWSDADIAAISQGTFIGDPKLAVLLDVIRDAATRSGHVAVDTWQAAADAGWSDTDLTEAFIYMALPRFIDDFATYAETELDVPAAPVRA